MPLVTLLIVIDTGAGWFQQFIYRGRRNFFRIQNNPDRILAFDAFPLSKATFLMGAGAEDPMPVDAAMANTGERCCIDLTRTPSRAPDEIESDSGM